MSDRYNLSFRSFLTVLDPYTYENTAFTKWKELGCFCACCMGTHTVFLKLQSLNFYPDLSSPATDLSEDTKVFYSGFPVHLLPISGHGTPVGSQHLLSGKQGPLYFFRWEFQAGKAKDDWPAVRHKTSWSRNLRALSEFPGWCLSCLSRLSVILCCCSDPIWLSAVPASAPWVFMLLPVLMSQLGVI